MKKIFPDWATEKQKEGMEKFRSVAEEFGNFAIVFEKSEDQEDRPDSFDAVVSWWNAYSSVERKHTFHIDFDFEQTWNHLHERIYQWQFVFGGEIGREILVEYFYLELFSELDKKFKPDSSIKPTEYD